MLPPRRRANPKPLVFFPLARYVFSSSARAGGRYPTDAALVVPGAWERFKPKVGDGVVPLFVSRLPRLGSWLPMSRFRMGKKKKRSGLSRGVAARWLKPSSSMTRDPGCAKIGRLPPPFAASWSLSPPRSRGDSFANAASENETTSLALAGSPPLLRLSVELESPPDHLTGG